MSIPPASKNTVQFPPSSMSPELREFYNGIRHGLPPGAVFKRGNIILRGGAACPPIRVKALCTGLAGANWTSIVEFLNPNDALVECEIPWSTLQGKPRDAIGLLADRGLHMGSKRVADNVLDLIRNWSLPRGAHDVLLSNAGWTADREVFAMSSGKVLSRGKEGPTYRLSGKAAGKEIGDLHGWKHGLAALCVGNPYLIFAISASFAAPLVAFTSLNSTIFHFHGTTSLGKSRTLMAALSTMPRTCKTPKTWTGTANGLEGEIAKSHGILAVLDELPLDTTPDFWGMVYRLANGTAKARAGKDGTAETRASWQTVILSAGEFSSRVVLEKLGKVMTGGQGVRIIDVPIAGRHGAFDKLHGHADGHGFATALDDAITETSGPAGMAFMQALLSRSDADIQRHVSMQIKAEAAALRQALGLFDPAHVPNGILRVLDAFALVTVAGQMATGFGLTGWSPDAVSEAVSLIARRWLEQRGMPADVNREAIEKTRAVIERELQRFAQIGDAGDGLPGYCDDEYFYLSSALFAEVHGSSRQNKAAAAEQLEQAGFLYRGGERNSFMVKMPASVPSRPRMYRISRNILNAASSKTTASTDN